jgi:hypothetical protein
MYEYTQASDFSSFQKQVHNVSLEQS